MKRLISRTIQILLLRPVYQFYSGFASLVGRFWLSKAKTERKKRATKILQKKLRTKAQYSTSNTEEIAGYDFWILIKDRGSETSRVVKTDDNYQNYIDNKVTYIGVYKTTNCTTDSFWYAWSAERFKTLRLHYYAYTDFYPIPFSAPDDIEVILNCIYDDHKRSGFFQAVSSDAIAGLLASHSVKNRMLSGLFLSHVLPELESENFLAKKNSGYVMRGKGITYLKELENQRLTHKENVAISNRHNLLVVLLVILGVVSNWTTLFSLFESANSFVAANWGISGLYQKIGPP